MTPKTNREKAAYIMAEPGFNIVTQVDQQAQFILRAALYLEILLSDQAHALLHEMYLQALSRAEGDECPKKGPEDEENDRTGQYLADGGNICPYCQSNDLDSGRIEADSTGAWTTVTCNNCLKTWDDVYTLTGVNWQ